MRTLKAFRRSHNKNYIGIDKKKLPQAKIKHTKLSFDICLNM